MPMKTEWVEPELALEHNGVQVYHVYKDDNFEDRLTYWFRTDKDENGAAFDVRELKCWTKGQVSPFSDEEQPYIIETLRKAIESGEIKAP